MSDEHTTHIGARLRDAADSGPEPDTIRIGAPLRDAAVEPRPGDASVPTNAGQADPHGPRVVAPQALTRQAQAATRTMAQEG